MNHEFKGVLPAVTKKKGFDVCIKSGAFHLVGLHPLLDLLLSMHSR
jgi:hypothetical protein